ncbi:3-carboxy-cis,cis-mucoante lactonizing enzyme [Rhizodiscina lignyota]|uniref:3-carboxy-cis,cis-mucoante lactonizing enzyme n=1 Tax=Rhizodiscina lignyota TaxID=1504668 RepID=A0A9P4IFP0_9PEZI|nr:3-carboxy-cis,cis-mucoante lactonizing enzyme [Rhizodiscina lignyota]
MLGAGNLLRMMHTLYVAHQSRGIITLTFDPCKPPSSSIQIENTVQAGYLPQWLTLHGDYVYSMSRTQFPDESSTSAGIFAFEKAELSKETGPPIHDGNLIFVSNTSSNGLGGVYCGIGNNGQTISAANINGGTVSIHPLSEKGQIGEATYVFNYNHDSEVQHNPHQAAFDPSGKWMLVPDRSADLLRVYRVAGPNNVTQVHVVKLPHGTGCRHVTFRAFSPTRTFAYLVSENDNTVRVFALDGVENAPECSSNPPSDKIEVKLLQTASTLGPGSNRTPPARVHLAAEVAISNDGRHFYASNRDTKSAASDTIAIYSVHPESESQHLEYLGQSETHGKIPRHFSLSPDPGNRYLAVANQVSNTIMIMRRDTDTGLIGDLVGEISLGDFDKTTKKGPVAVVWSSE